MKLRHLFLAGCTVAALSVPTISTASPPVTPKPSAQPGVTVFATGFNAPRGLAFSPRGQLYVAEAGSGGTDTTADLCPDLQLPAPVGGPTMNGPTARVSRVSPSGVRSTVVDGLPSLVTTFGGDPIGVADVTFVDGKLYALIAGGGCSNGNRDPKRPNGVIRVRNDGSWRYVVNLTSYYMSHPIADPPDDFTPDGVPYDMVRHGKTPGHRRSQ